MTETFNIDYISSALTLQIALKVNKVYEKIVIDKCPSTSEAVELIDKISFKTAFKENANAIAIVLKIDNELNEHDANVVQMLLKNHTRPLLIAFESNVDGGLIVYWRIMDMKWMLKTILDRIRVEGTSLSVPSNIIVDFLTECIKLNHDGEL
jgi:hypothetical protein